MYENLYKKLIFLSSKFLDHGGGSRGRCEIGWSLFCLMNDPSPLHESLIFVYENGKRGKLKNEGGAFDSRKPTKSTDAFLTPFEREDKSKDFRV